MANGRSGHGVAPPALTRRSFLGGAAVGVASAGVGVLLAGCGGDGTTPADAGGRRRVTFLTITPLSLGFSAELVADTGGHFAKEDLEVKFEFTRGSAQAIQALIAGTAPLTRIGDIEAMLAIANRGAPLVNVGMPVKVSVLRIVSSRSNPLQKPEDFRGKTIGIPSEGGTSETTLDLVLAAAKIDRQSVPRQVVGLTPGVFNLVQKGRIAGYFVSTDTAVQIRHQHPDAVVFSPSSVIASGGQFYAVSKQGLQRERDLIQRYLRAIRAAADSIIADKELDRTLELMRRKYNFDTLKDTAIAKESLRAEYAAWTTDGTENVLRVVPERWNNAYKELVAAGQVKAGLNPNDWFTNDLVKEG